MATSFGQHQAKIFTKA